ncbi:MAG: efflux RND transporter permease subunit [Azospirillaceae bacterium]|nr:efflux RND transporter permease subunit [Azospirillaceae bacterium]
MSISTPFIRRPIGTTLLMAAIFLAGLTAYPFLPQAPLPTVDFPTISVTANFPGASPETMASTVAQPLERQFAQINGVSQITSVNVLASSQVTVQFDLDRNIDAAAVDILEAINAAQGSLPKAMPSPPTFRKVNPADAPILILSVQSDTMPMTAVDDIAETILAQQISQIAGVSQVGIGGQQKPAIRITIDPARLAATGLTLEDVRTVINSATVNSPKGTMQGQNDALTVYANDQITDANEFGNVIVAYRNGAPIRIKDIGHAEIGPQTHFQAAWQDTSHGILLAVFKQPGSNMVATVARVKERLPRLEASIPASVHLNVIQDRTPSVLASIADVQFTLTLSIALVVMVIFLFLRSLWATVIPSITVPLALVTTLGAMYLLNYSLDNLSLMGLTIAVGFVVDDAIVMLENIHRHVEDGMTPMEAALKGAGEIGFTIVSISLSLIAVFIPLLLMGGIVGRLFREFAVTVSVTILISAFVSLTLTPMMCSLFLRHDTGQHNFLYRLVERGFDAIVGFYARTLDIVLRFQLITLIVFLGTMVMSGVLFVQIPKGFFPVQDVGRIQGLIEGGQNVSFAAMSRLIDNLGAVIHADPDVTSYNVMLGSSGQTGNNAKLYINLKPWSERTSTVTQVIARLQKKAEPIEGVRLYMQPQQDIVIGGRAARTMYQYTLQDSDGDELNSWSPRILDALRKLPQLTGVATDQQMSGRTATLVIDRDTAARFGIQAQQIDDTLYDAFGEREVAQYFTQVNSYYVVLEVPPSMAADPATLEKLYVRSSAGRAVPLSTFVKWDTAPVRPLAINHQSQFPAVTLSFNLAPGVALGDAVVAINKVTSDLKVPETILGTFQGTAQAFQDSLASEPYLIAAALLTVYVILGILYESFILPLTILSTLPSAGVGALLMLMMFHYDLSVIALIGVILLIGIVKKNGIMMVDFAIGAERREGATPLAAIRQACLLRFRPILMTTMAALLSGLPLMLGNGAGSEFRKPLGYAMVGGLIFSQVLTLYTTPVVYLYLGRLQHLLAPKRRARMPALAVRMGNAAD